MRSPVALAALSLLVLPAAARAGFYSPPAKVPAKHGTLIKHKRLRGAAVPPGGAGSELLLYSSKGIAGKPVAVSGSITYPRGRKPRRGWPVITFAHGTTGIADRCAPSRVTGATDPGIAGYTTYAFPLFTRWLRQGWAVARTDYEGLGTPGPHPYLIGTSEGRATLDIAAAARRVDRRRVVIAGHSQGGHAALWANALARSYAPKLGIRGTVAFAPASHVGEQAQSLSLLTQPSPLSGEAALILRGAEVQAPGLDVASLLSPEAAALYPRTNSDCLGALSAPDAFGGIAPADLAKPYADLSAVIAVLSANDSEDQPVRGPLRIEQGDQDGTVFPAFTDQTVKGYEDRGVKVDYDKRVGLTHAGIVTDPAAQKAATKWIAKRLK